MEIAQICPSSIIRFVAIFTLAASFVSYWQFSEASNCPQPSTTGNRYLFYPTLNGSSWFVQCVNGINLGNYSCPQGEAFKPRTSLNDTSPLCVLENTKYGEAVFRCSSNSSIKASYSADPTLYATCQNGAPVDLFECTEGEYFIDSLQRCNLTCAVRYKIGKFALPNSSTAYYQCDFDFGTLRWTLSIHECPSGESFNPSYQICLPP